jgi:hypothetical protein
MSEENPGIVKETITTERLPAGMIAIIIYLVYTLLVRTIALIFPFMLFGPFAVPRSIVKTYYLISVYAIALCLFGIYKRKKWGRILITIWYGFGILYIAVSSLAAFYFKTEYLNIYSKIFRNIRFQFSDTFFIITGIIIPLVTVLIINTLVIWYINARRDYFVN